MFQRREKSAWSPEQISIPHLKEQMKGTPPRPENIQDLERVFRHDFYKTVRPLLVGLTVSGRLPCKMSSDNKYGSAVCSFSFIYCLINFTLLSLVIIEQLYESLTVVLIMKFEFSVLLRHSSILALNLLLYAPIPLCLLKERNSIPDFINAWPPFLLQVKLKTGYNFRPKHGRNVKLFAFINPITTGVVLFVIKDSLLQGKLYRLPAYTILLVQYHYIVLLFVFSFLELKNISSCLENKIKQISNLEPFSTNTAPQLEELRRLWLQMASLVQQTGDAMSLSINFYAIIMIALFTVSWFATISSLIHPEYENSLDTFITGITTGLSVILLSEPAHHATEAVGGRIMRALSSIDLSQLSPAASQEVQYFWQTVSNNYPHITLTGRTKVNRQWLTSVLANVLTYLIVLIQFQATAFASLSKPQTYESGKVQDHTTTSSI